MSIVPSVKEVLNIDVGGRGQEQDDWQGNRAAGLYKQWEDQRSIPD